MSHDTVFEAVRAIVERVAGPDRVPPGVSPTTRLTEDCWLDSIELLKVILACESELHVTFDPAQDFGGLHFATLGSLSDLIRARRSTPRSDR